MRRILTAIAIAITVAANAKIVYVDYNDAIISPVPRGNATPWLYLDIDQDNTADINMTIAWTNVSCNSTNGTASQPYVYYCIPRSGSGNRLTSKTNCTNDTINHLDPFADNEVVLAMGIFPNIICSGNGAGSYKLGFRLTKKNPANNANGFIYGYIDYTLTTSGDIVVHGWHYNDAFNEPIVANAATPYPYNGCTYQDTVKTYVTVKIYDTIKVPKTVYDTVKVTKTEIVKKTVYDTVKIEKIVHKTVCDSTVLVHITDTVRLTVHDTIRTHVTVHDTVTKTIYQTVKVNVYDTIQIPTAVQDTLVATLGKNTGQRLRMWPNPASQTITLDLSSPDPANVLVIDQAGTTVADFPTRTQITTLDAGQWAQGTYTVTVTQGNNQTTKHIQINR